MMEKVGVGFREGRRQIGTARGRVIGWEIG